MLQWLVHERGVESHIPVLDKSKRADDTFSRSDFAFNAGTDTYRCPGGKQLTTTGTVVNDGSTLLYRASKHDCQACTLKPRCCPKEPARKVPRSIYEGARDLAQHRHYRGLCRLPPPVEKVEMLFAHLKRILRLDRLRPRGPTGARESSSSLAPLRTSASSPVDPGTDAGSGHMNGAVEFTRLKQRYQHFSAP